MSNDHLRLIQAVQQRIKFERLIATLFIQLRLSWTNTKQLENQEIDQMFAKNFIDPTLTKWPEGLGIRWKQITHSTFASIIGNRRQWQSRIRTRYCNRTILSACKVPIQQFRLWTQETGIKEPNFRRHSQQETVLRQEEACFAFQACLLNWQAPQRSFSEQQTSFLPKSARLFPFFI